MGRALLLYDLVPVANEETAACNPELVRAYLGALRAGYVAAITDTEASFDALSMAAANMNRVVEHEGLLAQRQR